ncbi:hypothetical protein BGX33_002110, partial [Mortierella sp. NVP41]
MDPLSVLPLECLQRILETLAQDNNSAALAALLRTSRYFSTVTLPFLYKEPFKFAPFVSHHNEKEDIPIVSRIPTRILFTSLSHSNLSRILSLGLEPITDPTMDAEPTTATATATATTLNGSTSLDYLVQIRHLHFQPWAIGVDHLWKWSHAPLSVLAYIQTEEFVQKCKLSNLTPIPNWLGIPKLDSEFYQRCYQVLFFREASWALASPILEQLQSLSIPFSQIGRYAAEVGRLRSLKRVVFILDEVAVDLELIPGRETEESHQKSAVHFRPMMQFVEEHTRLFKDLLRSVTTTNSTLWTGFRVHSSGYSERIQLEINRLLPSLWRPISLGQDDLLRFLANPEATDLSRVVEIDATGLYDGGRDAFLENRQALRRCRALKRLKTWSLGEGSFKWAVDEKRMFEQYDQTIPFRSSDLGNEQDALSIRMDGIEDTFGQPEYWRKSLVPLEEVEISDYDGPLTEDVVNDIALAFNQTLKSFKASYYVSSFSKPKKFTTLVANVGQGWVDLPLLTHLALCTSHHRLVIDRKLLACCPNVVSVGLSDDTLEYR